MASTLGTCLDAVELLHAKGSSPSSNREKVSKYRIAKKQPGVYSWESRFRDRQTELFMQKPRLPFSEPDLHVCNESCSHVSTTGDQVVGGPAV